MLMQTFASRTGKTAVTIKEVMEESGRANALALGTESGKTWFDQCLTHGLKAAAAQSAELQAGQVAL